MSRHTPALNALRVFETAARHMNFTRAGEELNMSQAAVSQRIKSLENSLGKPLFYRANRTLDLTDVGRAYLPAVRDALERLDNATEQLFERTDSRVLSVRVASSFATLWLAPRLSRFQDANPDIDIRLITTSNIEYHDLDISFDAEIRYGTGHWPGLRADRLMDVDVFPVCAPALGKQLNSPHDLRAQTLIHVIGYDEDWHMWLSHAGIDDVSPTRGMQMDATVTALQAAQDGAGVALGRAPLVGGLIRSGRLITPFAQALRASKSYYLVSPAGRARRPEMVAFRRWLSDETAGEP